MMKSIKKKYIILVLLVGCLCAVPFVLHDTFQEDGNANKAETFVLHDTFQENGNTNKAEMFGDFLSRVTEEDFIGEDGIISAHAEVIYDKTTEQYSLELSLTTDREISEEQFELYKSALNKTFEDIVIIVNGVIVQ